MDDIGIAIVIVLLAVAAVFMPITIIIFEEIGKVRKKTRENRQEINRMNYNQAVRRGKANGLAMPPERPRPERLED